MPSIWREVKTLTIPSASNPGSIFEALLSPHAQYLAVASGHEVQIWDLRKALPNSENSQSSFSNEHLSVHKMSWCQGTTQLAIGHDKGLVSVLDIQEGVVWMEGFGLAEALVSPVSGLAWLSPVLLAVSMGSTVEIWRFESEYKGDDGQRSWSFCGRIPDPPIMANQTEPPLILTIHALADHQLLLQYPDGGGRTLIWNLTFGPFIARLSIVPWKLPHGINDVSAASGHALYTDHGSGMYGLLKIDSQQSPVHFYPQTLESRAPQPVSCVKFISQDLLIGGGVGQLILWSRSHSLRRLQNLVYNNPNMVPDSISSGFQLETDAGWIATTHRSQSVGEVVIWCTFDYEETKAQNIVPGYWEHHRKTFYTFVISLVAVTTLSLYLYQ